MTPSDEEIERLVGLANAGDRKALDELFAAAYQDLKRIARSRLWHGGRSTMMNTTAVVHETFVRVCGGGQLRAESRAAFLA